MPSRLDAEAAHAADERLGEVHDLVRDAAVKHQLAGEHEERSDEDAPHSNFSDRSGSLPFGPAGSSAMTSITFPAAS